ncbi:MAG: 3',5'-cyclic-nucleotide phosphodiesterase [Acidobacteriota bacterium]
MKIKLLPSNIDANLQTFTTFLINDEVTIDAGSLAVALTPAEMAAIGHVIVTHTHNDHIASLPVLIAEAFTHLETPVMIYGIEEVITGLQAHIFNDAISPDFTKIHLAGTNDGAIRYQTLEPRKRIDIGGLQVTPIPVNHTVPSCGMMVEDQTATVIFSADTYVTDELWQVASDAANLKAIFVDVSYPNELEGLARVAKHFTPESLAGDLQKLKCEAEIYAMHIKPSHHRQVIAQLRALNHPRLFIAEVGRVYEW